MRPAPRGASGLWGKELVFSEGVGWVRPTFESELRPTFGSEVWQTPLMLLCNKLFLLSPALHPIQSKGEPKWYDGVIIVLGISAALQQTPFIVSGSPSNPIQGEVTKCYDGVIIVLGISAASQQTLFIVSSSPSNPILGEVTQMLWWGHNSLGG